MTISKEELIDLLRSKKRSLDNLSFSERSILFKPLSFSKKNRLVVHTKHDLFNQRTSTIPLGGGLSETCFCSLVRCENKINPASPTKKSLQQQDLDKFNDYAGGYFVKSYIKQYLQNSPCFLYVFFNENNAKQQVIHGFVLTDELGKHLFSVASGPTARSKDVISEMKQYVSY